MNETQGQLLELTRKALDQGDRRAAHVLLRKALQRDPSDQDAWDMLYASYGEGQPFSAFKDTFAARYLQPVAHTPNSPSSPRRFPRRFTIDFDPTSVGFLSGMLSTNMTYIGLGFLFGQQPGTSLGTIILALMGGLAGMASSYFAILKLRTHIQSWQRYPISILAGALAGIITTPITIVILVMLMRLFR